MGLYTLFFKQQREYQIIDLFFSPNNKNNNVYFKKLLSEMQCVMLIVAQLHGDFLPRWWITASCTTRPHRHSHGYAISLIQLISKSTIYYPSSPRLWWGMERQKGIRLPGNWKGARAARDVRLLWFIRRAHTHSLMRIACVRLARWARGSGLRGAVGWRVAIGWRTPADEWERREGLGCGSVLGRVRVYIWL